MILWCDGAHGARENMRRDERLLERLAGPHAGSDSREPVLRLFAFAPPGITLGRAQSPERCLDLERCRADGVEWAIRPTGGRAIFHADEWTYSLSARIDDPDWGGGLLDAYARASRLILASLRAVGIPATPAATGRRPRQFEGAPAGHPSVAPALDGADPCGGANSRVRPSCFAATARHEIELGGRKLVGSAQRRTATALLQQGSVLLGPGHLRLVDYLALDEPAREPARLALARNAAAGVAHARVARGLERWADAIARALGPGVRRFFGDEGASLLTLAEPGSYTAASSN